MIMIYPKINSLWKRQGWYLEGDKKKSADYQAGRQSFIVGDYAQPEFGIFKYWHVEEKIDGTNIRLIMQKDLSDEEATLAWRVLSALVLKALIEA